MSTPRLPRLLLQILLRDPIAREVILGDLEEGHHARSSVKGRSAAARWYWRQALATAWACRSARGRRATPTGSPWSGLWQDLRHGVRLAQRAPGFTAMMVATAGLGIAGVTTVFSLADAVLLRPLAYAEPARLVYLSGGSATGQPTNVGFETVLDWSEQSHSFEALALFRSWQPTLLDGEAERLGGIRLSAVSFRALGVSPALGRDFLPAEDHPDHRFEVILSNALWRRRFSADPAILGRALDLGGQPYQVVGVLPPSFDATLFSHVYGPAEIYAPLGYLRGRDYACRSCRHLRAFGRLKAGATPATAREDLEGIQRRLTAAYPREYSGHEIALERVDAVLSSQARPALGILLGAVGLVLLIACANAASLVLARGSRRAAELRLRAALGAGRAQLVRQLVAESILLSGLGGLAGVGLAALAIRIVVQASPVRFPRLDAAALDLRVLAVALLVTLVSGVVVGLVPALGLSRARAASVDAALRIAGSTVEARGRRVLVVLNLAMAFVLLVGAGLTLRSVERLLRVDPGFDPRQVVTASLNLGSSLFDADEQANQAREEILRRVDALPGVEVAALAGQLPLGGDYDFQGVQIEGRPAERSEDLSNLQRFAVTPDYFTVLRIPLLQGRLLETSDREGSELVLLLSQMAAGELFPGESALGKRLRFAGPEEAWRTVVGVVGDVRHESLSAAFSPQMYLPQAQNGDRYLSLALRTRGEVDPAVLVPALRREIAAVSREIPVYGATTLERLAAGTAARERFTSGLLGAFSLSALLLAAVGLYGLISFLVEGRRREVGVRLALGATARDVVRVVLRPGLLLVGAGLVLGWALALPLSRALESVLFEMSPFDLGTYALITALLGVAALLAHLAPLLRALQVNPNTTLRQE